jgi:hypothetical protein
MEMQRIHDMQSSPAESHVRFHVDDHDEGAPGAAPAAAPARPSVSFKAPEDNNKKEGASSSAYTKSSSVAPRSSLADVDEFESAGQDGLLRRHTSFLEHDDNVRTVLVWQDLTVTSPQRGSNKPKVLLDHVSGSMTGQHTTAPQRLLHLAIRIAIRIPASHSAS